MVMMDPPWQLATSNPTRGVRLHPRVDAPLPCIYVISHCILLFHVFRVLSGRDWLPAAGRSSDPGYPDRRGAGLGPSLHVGHQREVQVRRRYDGGVGVQVSDTRALCLEPQRHTQTRAHLSVVSSPEVLPRLLVPLSPVDCRAVCVVLHVMLPAVPSFHLFPHVPAHPHLGNHCAPPHSTRGPHYLPRCPCAG